MRRFLLWVKICRPQTLFASLVPVLVTFLLTGFERPAVGVITALCALSLQILSNLINDYYDFRRGADKAGRVGFKRALSEGEVTESQMRLACILVVVVACILGLYLVMAGGWVILAIGLSALLFAWLYTATSHSLSYLGIADIFVFLYYGIVASCGTAYLQGVTSWEPIMERVFFAGAVCGLISMCVLMINNLRDIEDDRKAGKHTLPVRLGKRTGEILILVYVLLMPVFAWLAFSKDGGFTLPVLIIVPAFALWVTILRAKGAAYNKCLIAAGLLNLCYYLLCVFKR
ncbi:MAG: 1,4-dihydroxy-2-naphthoate octaprenyltransferase [Bacteroidales bacterium]|nr:1,4-dihydroxy-2-naphthoate octaprenyltransferase [Bacteroidales bacterium]